MSQDLSQWSPPQAKWIKLAFSCVIGFFLLMGGAALIHAFVPTLTDAVQLVTNLLANLWTMALTAGGLLVTLWLMYETLSPHGKINGLFAQAYNSFINKLTWELLDVDPITPLLDKQREMEVKKEQFDEAYASFDGTISHIQETENRYRAEAEKKKNEALAAQKRGMQQAFENASYDYGTFRDTADNMAKMRARLEPVRATIGKLQEATGQVIRNLDTDIKVMKDQWELQKSMAAMDKAGRVVLGKTSREDLAMQAQALIQQRYGEQIGRLDNLSKKTQPLLQSIDLQKATYSEELLAELNAEAAQVTVQGSPLSLTKAETPVLPVLDQTSFATLIRK